MSEEFVLRVTGFNFSKTLSNFKVLLLSDVSSFQAGGGVNLLTEVCTLKYRKLMRGFDFHLFELQDYIFAFRS